MAEELREQYAMTLRRLKQICAEREGYQRPELNETLELQYKGFGKIENLHHYHNCNALFLEQNSFAVIEGLEKLDKLKCLYLSKNRICKIENISHLSNLCHLDLSHNPIEKVEGLAGLTSLKIFKITHCRIEKLENLEGVKECQSIESIDVKHNQIEATDEVPDFWGRVLPDLQCLYYSGNPGLRTIKQYRKRCIGALKNLKYLDERPVFEDERATSEAWCSGGMEAEKAKRQEIHEKKVAKENDDREKDLAWRERVRQQHEAGDLPYVLPTAKWEWENTEQGALSDLWKQINDAKISEDPNFPLASEVVTPASPAQTPQDQDPNYNFDPPARVEEVLQNECSDGSWQLLAGTSQGPASESGQSASERSVTAASDLSSQRAVQSEAATATGGTPQQRSRAPSTTGGDSVAPAWQWTNIRDRRLQALAALHNHHFTRAAAVLSHEFGDVVSEALCRKRYGNIMRGTNSVATADIQERDAQFYYRRMQELSGSEATVANVNERLMQVEKK